jgi:hypothetical protein
MGGLEQYTDAVRARPMYGGEAFIDLTEDAYRRRARLRHSAYAEHAHYAEIKKDAGVSVWKKGVLFTSGDSGTVSFKIALYE